MVNPEWLGRVHSLPIITTCRINIVICSLITCSGSRCYAYWVSPNTSATGTFQRSETHGLHRTLHHSHGRIVHHCELAVQDIPIRSARHRCCRSLCPYRDPPWSYGSHWPKTKREALLFGKNFLRMAGIVQMLHRLQTPYDKYSYNAHRKRKRLV